jgi:hypothetical protein
MSVNTADHNCATKAVLDMALQSPARIMLGVTRLTENSLVQFIMKKNHSIENAFR